MLQNFITLQDVAPAAGGGLSGIFMIVILIAIFYFMMIRPQQKKQKEIKKFREGLAKGDNVITAGGIYGKIKEVRQDSFLITVADGVCLRVDKGSIYPNAADAQTDVESKKVQ
ncbi:MAG: preprotein translocase subunit YajC [Bacteroidales bacterium]|nr:preprotein translocase subunit YajC [Bacteroidales bacterium]